jgi:hypothetical protein
MSWRVDPLPGKPLRADSLLGILSNRKQKEKMNERKNTPLRIMDQ